MEQNCKKSMACHADFDIAETALASSSLNRGFSRSNPIRYLNPGFSQAGDPHDRAPSL
jgi:hypothetical protein